MQKALVVALGGSLLSHFGERISGSTVSVRRRLCSDRSRVVAYRGMVTRASEQVAKAGQEPHNVEVDDEDSVATGSHPVTRKAYRDDMEESYGVGYATRAADMGYGQVYGEAVKAILDKKSDKMGMQKGASAERDQHADAFVEAEYDTTQGEPVAQKEVGRHSTVSASIETEKKAHQPAAEAGGHGGAAT
ncbi:uncharacterized protein [Physcomitrium patens]|uniref:Uncharacterized protein n=1 Tax=Physcomitrium patens TaxID=3218 RepID=A0A2K1K2I8_PHYPA|nr:uncharacterized protein LOC112286505 [Physcomitrium patens]PNR47985.1 hypothetical protein PHYPA_012458 [Physcomitrium patens]|eukprot:XP_024384206.1 uncharacterized protein LOC112286505 [Physcomitrella patens]